MNDMMLALLLPAALAAAEDDLDPAALPVKAEVREAAIFKDGHAFILAEALVPRRSGWFVTTDVPEAILGSLWVFSGSPDAKVEVVRAGFEDFDREEPCLTLQDTLAAAVGQEVVLNVSEGLSHPLEGTILEVGRKTSPSPLPGTPPQTVFGETLHVRTPSGIDVVRLSSVRSIRLKKGGPLRKTVRDVRRRILVRVAVAPGGGDAPLPLRFVYVQRGLRWIPEYRVEVLPDRRLRIALQATVVNELADLRNVQASFVAGIPNFLMKETLSPLALREAAAGLSSYFPSSARFAQMTSNALVSQVARYTESAAQADRPEQAGVDMLVRGTSADEYFLYSQPGVTMRKGERASYSVFEAAFPYEDVYTLRIGPVAPRFIAGDRADEIRHALLSPKVVHGLKIRNLGPVPWTTGPALIVRDGRGLAQELLRFTPAGGEALLPVAELADVAVRTRDVEQKRVANVRIDGTDYTQVFMKGTVCLVSHRKEPLAVDVDRIFFGQAVQVHDGGTSEAFDFASRAADPYARAGWPHWWHSVNGMFQATWRITAQPGKASEATCEWSYFRR